MSHSRAGSRSAFVPPQYGQTFGPQPPQPVKTSTTDSFLDNHPEVENALENVRAVSSKVEDYIEQYSQPIRPHLPAIGRFLIVVTFLEDALRM